jgi:glyoxylase-like metal-dependent hydrolase (beta-lactamase superfamily II)
MGALHVDEADGVHRVEDAYTNWYLVEDDGRLTVVDAGVPTSWKSFHDALARLGRTPSAVEAVVLTHGHFDHVGFAERARSQLGVPVYVHDNDVSLTKHPWRYDHERPRSLYFATQVRALPIVASLVRNRAWWPTPVNEVVRYHNGELPVPGSPHVVFTPGHTHGHCALHLPDRDTVIAETRSLPSIRTPPKRGRASSRAQLPSTATATCPASTLSRRRALAPSSSATADRGGTAPRPR